MMGVRREASSINISGFNSNVGSNSRAMSVAKITSGWRASTPAKPTCGYRSAVVNCYVEQCAAEFAPNRPLPPPIVFIQLQGCLSQLERVGMHEQQARLIWHRG